MHCADVAIRCHSFGVPDILVLPTVRQRDYQQFEIDRRPVVGNVFSEEHRQGRILLLWVLIHRLRRHAISGRSMILQDGVQRDPFLFVRCCRGVPTVA